MSPTLAPFSPGRLDEYVFRLIIGSVTTVVFGSFEWDAKKAETNLAKHGISFVEAAEALDDPNEIAVEDPTHIDHVVSLVLSPKTRILVVVTTVRGDRTRIISARKANSHETRSYHAG